MKKFWMFFLTVLVTITLISCPESGNGGNSDLSLEEILASGEYHPVESFYLAQNQNGSAIEGNTKILNFSGDPEQYIFIFFEPEGLGSHTGISVSFTRSGGLRLSRQAVYDDTGTWGWGSPDVYSGYIWDLSGGNRWGEGDSTLNLSTLKGICIRAFGSGTFELTGVYLTGYSNPNKVLASEPNGHIFNSTGGTVTLTPALEGAVIYYTLDRSTPTTQSTVYSTPFTITNNTYIKAIATKEGYDDSDLTEFKYTVVKTNQAMQFAESMKIGWNLGNTFDGHGNLMPNETSWQPTTTTAGLMTAVKNHGFVAVRIPVTWGQKLHSQLNRNPGNINLTIDQINALNIDSAWLNRVETVVKWAKDAGLKAIINIHHDGADSHYWLSVNDGTFGDNDITGENKEKVDAIFIRIWTLLAERFKDEGDYLIFEGFNELRESDENWGNGRQAQWNRINELNQIFVDTVRSVGGNNENRYLVVSPYVTRPGLLQYLVLPYDETHDRIIANFHYYDPYSFTGDASQSTWTNTSSVINTFNPVKTRFTDKGIPVIIGEYGAVNQATAQGKEYRRYYMEYVTKHAYDCGFVPFYWDNNGLGTGSEKFGLISRTSPYNASNDSGLVIDAMIRAVTSNYSINDIVVPTP